MIALARAAERFDVGQCVREIGVRLLFIICSRDAIFPPDPEVPRLLQTTRCAPVSRALIPG